MPLSAMSAVQKPIAYSDTVTKKTPNGTGMKKESSSKEAATSSRNAKKDDPNAARKRTRSFRRLGVSEGSRHTDLHDTG